MNLLFATAMAEETTELSQALEGATKEEALAAGTILGLGMGIILTIGIVYFILRVIADWKIFTKAGRAGWKSIVPILAEYEEFDLCWKGSTGLLYGVITMALIMNGYDWKLEDNIVVPAVTILNNMAKIEKYCLK